MDEDKLEFRKITKENYMECIALRLMRAKNILLPITLSHWLRRLLRMACILLQYIITG